MENHLKTQMAKLFLTLDPLPPLQTLLYMSYKILMTKLVLKSKIFFQTGFCTICGTKTLFFLTGNHRETIRCMKCSSNSRQRFMAYLIKNILIKNPDKDAIKSFFSLDKNILHLNLSSMIKKFNKENGFLDHLIYEPDSRGKIHHSLKSSKNYICSEYFPNEQLGIKFKGIQNEDLQKLTFSDNSIDLIITQDIFEHIRDKYKAFEEIYRVLKPGGIHLCCVPFNKEKTRTLISPEDKVLDPPIRYHSDFIDTCRSKIYTSFGPDIVDILEEKLGFKSIILHTYNRFYGFVPSAKIILSIK